MLWIDFLPSTMLLKYLLHDIQKKVASKIDHRIDVNSSLQRMEIMIKPIDLLQLLQSMNQSTKIYWQSKDNSLRSVCFGKVCYYTFDEIQKEFKKKNDWIEKKIRFYGAIPFLFDFTLKKKWKDFKKAHFIVPRYEFFQKKKKYYLAINFRLKDNILSDFSELIVSYQEKTDPFGMLQIKKKKYIPTKKKWQSNLIKVKKLDKLA